MRARKDLEVFWSPDLTWRPEPFKGGAVSYKEGTPVKPFDPTDRRCIFPKCGKIINNAMQANGYNNTSLAAKLGIDHTAVAGYRRGFSRPNDAARIAQIEELLGVKLDMSELTPSAKHRNELEHPTLAMHPVLDHLAAAALALGFKATFVPVNA